MAWLAGLKPDIDIDYGLFSAMQEHQASRCARYRAARPTTVPTVQQWFTLCPVVCRPTRTVHQWIVSEVPVDSPVGAIRCRHARPSSSGRSARARRCITTAPCSERSGAMHSPVPMRASVRTSAEWHGAHSFGSPHTEYTTQHTTYGMQQQHHKTCSSATFSMQRATCNIRATYNM